MAPENKRPSLELVPPIPTYDEAIQAGGSRSAFDGDWQRNDFPHSPIDDSRSENAEGQSLLTSRHPNTSQNGRNGRRPGGYRPPTVETDDEDSWGSDSDSDGEADQVRREMQEMEIDDPADRSRNSWGKRMGFNLALPQWRWKWRWRLPRVLLRRAGGGTEGQEGPSGATGNTTNTDGEETTPRRRFSFPSLPKFGSTALFFLVARLFALFLIIGLLYLLFSSDLFTTMSRRWGSQMFDPESVRMFVQNSMSPSTIRENAEHFTQYAHLAGTEGDYALAERTESLFKRYGLEEVKWDVYNVYLNYPKKDGRAVQILDDNGKPTWWAKLEEDRDPNVARPGHPTFAFHGHSKSGDVTGPLIYVNYGSREDFQRLKDEGIDTRGAIALVRYGGTQSDRALKVKAAELAGFSGCLIYSDPADDGFKKGIEAPNGPFMPKDGVQRGSVSLMSWVVGDVLTPGWESRPGMPRMKVEQTKGLVKIPSLPLAWRDAQVLLKAIKGFGRVVPDGWHGGVPEVEWWTGNRSSPVVRLKNQQDEVKEQPIWNVYGKILGVEQDQKSIIIGNHRDSWTYGAADPASGTAVMLELARVFGDLMSRGWRPKRTIEFMSWDAEQYNLIGSTEYVEQNDAKLRNDAYAYINLDTAVTGSQLHAAGSPVFRKLLLQVLHRVQDPLLNTTLRQRWDDRKGELEGLGAGSDYVAFQDIVGTSSLDLHFDGEGYPYHSNYETYDWMNKVGDPDFVYHTLLAQVVGLIVLELADRNIVPFDMRHYGDSLNRWVDDIISWAKKNGPKGQDDTGGKGGPSDTLSLGELKLAAGEAAVAIEEFAKWETYWENNVMSGNGWESVGLYKKRCEYNDRMALFETDLLDGDGVSFASLPTFFLFCQKKSMKLILSFLSPDTKPHPVQARPFRAAALVRLRRGLLSVHPRYRYVGQLDAGPGNCREGRRHHQAGFL